MDNLPFNGGQQPPFFLHQPYQPPSGFPAPLDLDQAQLYYLPNAFSTAEGSALMHELRRELDWQQRPIKLYGRLVQQPRLSVWVGDPGVAYTYSSTRHEPDPWSNGLLFIRRRLESICQWRFNSVLGNLYRDGADGMGWHSDNEPELGPHPVIASLSFGEERRFVMRSKADSKVKRELVLQHGSLLLMAGYTQKNWQHALPKSKKPMSARMNLTYRWVF